MSRVTPDIWRAARAPAVWGIIDSWRALRALKAPAVWGTTDRWRALRALKAPAAWGTTDSWRALRALKAPAAWGTTDSWRALRALKVPAAWGTSDSWRALRALKVPAAWGTTGSNRAEEKIYCYSGVYVLCKSFDWLFEGYIFQSFDPACVFLGRRLVLSRLFVKPWLWRSSCDVNASEKID